MKKFIPLLLFVAFVCSASAQSSDQKFHFGLKAVPSLAWLRTDSKDLNSNGSKLAFSYGLMTEFNFAKNYAFATGVDITYRGGKFKSAESFKNTSGNDSLVTTEYTNNLQYVEIPITLKLKTNEIGYFTYFLQFGISPGINIRARQDYKRTVQSAGSTTYPDSTNVDIKKDINNLNLSMIISGGMEYSISGNTVLLAAISFNNGFLDVLDSNKQKANSNYLGLSIGILF